MPPTHSHSYDPSVVSSRFTTPAVDTVFALTLAVLSVWIVVTATGDPELLALVASAGIGVVLAGYLVLALTSRSR